MKIEFGKYKGQDINQLPDGYLFWLLPRLRELLKAGEEELQKRGKHGQSKA